MFEAGGYGVALTVAPARPLDPDAWGPAPEGVTRRPARLTDVLDVDGFDDAEIARELGAVAVGRAKLAAYEAALVAGLAARRPQQSDLTGDQPGHGVEGYLPGRAPAGVSEFFADELAVVAGISRAAATALTERALVLRRELPDTWAALADGLIDQPRANAIVKVLGGQSQDAGGRVDPAVVGEVEAQALGWALAGETPVRLAERVAAALIAVDAAAADRRRRKAEQCMDVQAKATADGMGQLVADLPMPVAAACRDAVDGYARMLKADGDTRPIGQLRALVLQDLVLRPWDTTREPVTAHLQVLAPLPGLGSRSAGAGTRPTGGDLRPCTAPTDADTATVDGAPITAGQLRELLEQLDALCPGGLQAPVGGSMGISLTDPGSGALRATVTRGELEALVRRGCPRSTAPPPTAGARCSTSVRRWTATGPPRRSSGSSRPGTAPAGTPAAGGRRGGPRPITSTRTPRVGRPPAKTSKSPRHPRTSVSACLFAELAGKTTLSHRPTSEGAAALADKQTVFIAFASEDEGIRNLFTGQRVNPKTPFEFIDLSVKEAYETGWKEKVRTRIRRSDGVVALISKSTPGATGELWEITCAVEEGVPLLGIWIEDGYRTKPREMGAAPCKPWTWDNVSNFIDGL